MRTELILGRAGSGKTRYLMRVISELLRDPLKKILVIVPEQFTFETEQQIIASCKVEGILGLQVLSFNRLAKKILEETGARNLKTVSGCAKTALIDRAAREAELSVYAAAAGRPGFAASMAEVINELKKYRIRPQDLEIQEQNALARKLKDLKRIYEGYEQLAGEAKDLEDLNEIAADRVSRSQVAAGATLIVDGFDAMTGQMRYFTEQLLCHAEEAYLSFRVPAPGDRDEHLFHLPDQLAKHFWQIAQSAGEVRVTRLPAGEIQCRQTSAELAHLERNLYAGKPEKYPQETKDIRLFHGTRGEEIAAAAAEICRLVRKEGYRYRDIGVLANTAQYAALAQAEFERDGIPLFCDRKEGLKDSNLMRYALSALDAADSWRMDAVIEYLQTGLTGLTQEEAELFLQCAKTYALRGFQLKKPVARIRQPEFEEIRAKLITPLQELGRALAGKAVEGKLEILTVFLKNVQEQIEADAQRLEELSMLKEASLCRQSYVKTLEMLEELRGVFVGARMDTRGFGQMLQAAAEGVEMSAIPPSADAVYLGDLKKSKLKQLRAVFLLGLNDGEIPSNDNSCKLLSACEIEEMERRNLHTSFFSNVEIERMDIYSAMTQPKDRLYLSCQGQNESILVARLKQIFPRLTLDTAERAVRPMGKKGTFLQTVRAVNGYLGGRELPRATRSALRWFLDDPQYRQAFLRVARQFVYENPPRQIARETAGTLYGNFHGSATRIEAYSACPFQFFLEHGLKIQPEREFGERRLDAGTVMHGALDRFFKKNGTDFLKQTSNETEEMLNACVQEEISAAGREILSEDKRFTSLLTLIKRQLHHTVDTMKWQFSQTGARVYLTEAAFGEGKPIPPVSVRLDDGRDVALKGIIDRVDLMEADGQAYFRIVDYKSSKKTLEADEFAAGIRIQLVVYLMAMFSFFAQRGARPSGAYYFDLSLEFLKPGAKEYAQKRMNGLSLDSLPVLVQFSGQEETGALKAVNITIGRDGQPRGDQLFTEQQLFKLFDAAREIVKAAVGEMYSGCIEVRPLKLKRPSGSLATCRYCQYQSICRFDEQYRQNAFREVAAAGFDEVLR